MSKKYMRMRHKNNRLIRILKQFLQKINFISSIRADDRAAIEKAEREQNASYCLGISFMLCIFSLTGLIGTFAPQTSGSIFPQVNATMVYAVLLGVSLVFFLLFSGEVLKLKNRIRLADWIFPLFYVLNMIMASFTFLTTEKGSSYFFEFILLTLLVYLFPLHAHRELALLFLSSMAAFILVSLLVNRFYAWQDLFDLAMLHFFCIAISIVRWNMFVHDISLQISLKNAQNELYGKSRIDVLTGLQNRMALRDDFDSFLNANLCVALLDVDSFKQLNDTYGHYYGDKILSFLGESLRVVFDRPDDSCYRYGGDEMLIISHDQVPEAFYGRLKQLQELCADEEKNGFRVELSIGCCSGTPGTAEELRRCIGLADRCLYDVKSTEKGKIKGCLLNQSKGKAEEEKQRRQDFLMTLVSFDEMKARFELAVRDHPDWSVVYFDICHFSEIDEKFGFGTGRWVLEKVAALIDRDFPDAVLANPELDHLILYCFLPEEEICRRTEEVQRKASAILPRWYLRLWAGVYHHTPGKKEISFLQAVNDAQYAKNSLVENREQSGICFYSDDLDEKKKREIFFRGHIGEAMQESRIVPYYQPIVGSFSGKCIGFAVKSRWKDPHRGTILPEEYVPYLVRMQEAYKLDLHILARACGDAEKMLDRNRDRDGKDENHPWFFNICVYGLGCGREGLTEEIDETVSRYQVPKDFIHLEACNLLPENMETFQRDVGRLVRRGYHVWLNPYGNGVDCLNILADAMITGMKIRGDLFGSPEKDKRYRMLNNILLKAGHELGIRVIAEEIKNEDQLRAVRQAGVDWAQGSCFAEPMPFDRLIGSRYVENLLTRIADEKA